MNSAGEPRGPPSRHVVQLYREEGFLHRAVARWVSPPLESDGGAILLGRADNVEAIRAALVDRGLDVDALEERGRLAIVEAPRFMAGCLVDGVPDEARFLRLVAALTADVRAACDAPAAEIRAWGEIVDILLKDGDAAAAQRLETLWNAAIDRERIRLLCSYGVDNLDPATHDGLLRDICRGHTQLLPEEHPAPFERALKASMAQVMGAAAAAAFWHRHATKPPLNLQMPSAEAVLIALHDFDRETSEAVLARVRESLTAGDTSLVPAAF